MNSRRGHGRERRRQKLDARAPGERGKVERLRIFGADGFKVDVSRVHRRNQQEPRGTRFREEASFREGFSNSAWGPFPIHVAPLREGAARTTSRRWCATYMDYFLAAEKQRSGPKRSTPGGDGFAAALSLETGEHPAETVQKTTVEGAAHHDGRRHPSGRGRLPSAVPGSPRPGFHPVAERQAVFRRGRTEEPCGIGRGGTAARRFSKRQPPERAATWCKEAAGQTAWNISRPPGNRTRPRKQSVTKKLEPVHQPYSGKESAGLGWRAGQGQNGGRAGVRFGESHAPKFFSRPLRPFRASRPPVLTSSRRQ